MLFSYMKLKKGISKGFFFWDNKTFLSEKKVFFGKKHFEFFQFFFICDKKRSLYIAKTTFYDKMCGIFQWVFSLQRVNSGAEKMYVFFLQ